ncbi:MAG: type II secretion system protein GspG [Oligoflexia bacterium]|nr:type II secretion system protein GspG [Oligoflexia bacterium]
MRISWLETKNRGYTLIELTMTILLIGILAVGSISVMEVSLVEDQFDNTVKSMLEIRNALIGDPEAMKDGIRTSSFGILGDIGALPTADSTYALNALLLNPGYPAWALDITSPFGIGWNGPYLSNVSFTTSSIKDAWGVPYIYNVASDGSGILTSLGADKVAGGDGANKDIIMSLPVNLIKATVNGFLLNRGQPFIGAAIVTIYYPDGQGFLTSATQNLVQSDAGFFSFPNIPFGTRLVTVTITDSAYYAQTIRTLFTVDRDKYVIATNFLNMNLNKKVPPGLPPDIEAILATGVPPVAAVVAAQLSPEAAATLAAGLPPAIAAVAAAAGVPAVEVAVAIAISAVSVPGVVPDAERKIPPAPPGCWNPGYTPIVQKGELIFVAWSYIDNRIGINLVGYYGLKNIILYQKTVDWIRYINNMTVDEQNKTVSLYGQSRVITIPWSDMVVK